MKRKILVVALIVSILGVLSGCGNKVLLDTTYTYDFASIKLPDGTLVEGEVDEWCDYDGEQLQITIDGVTYLVNSNNVVLVSK